MVTSTHLKVPLLLAVIFAPVVAGIGFSSPPSGLVINLSIAENLDANYYLVNKSSGPVQKLYIAWENSGSVGCTATPRITFTSEDGDTTHTAWARPAKMWPGSSVDWLFYTALPPGNYSSEVEVRYCRRSFLYGPYSVQSVKTNSSDVFNVVGNTTRKNEVEISITSNRTVENVVVTPTDYPTGWIFASNKIDSIEAGSRKAVELYYKPTLWKKSEATVTIATMDGEYRSTEEILLQRDVEKGLLERFRSFFSTLRNMWD